MGWTFSHLEASNLEPWIPVTKAGLPYFSIQQSFPGLAGAPFARHPPPEPMYFYPESGSGQQATHNSQQSARPAPLPLTSPVTLPGCLLIPPPPPHPLPPPRPLHRRLPLPSNFMSVRPLAFHVTWNPTFNISPISNITFHVARFLRDSLYASNICYNGLHLFSGSYGHADRPDPA